MKRKTTEENIKKYKDSKIIIKLSQETKTIENKVLEENIKKEEIVETVQKPLLIENKTIELPIRKTCHLCKKRLKLASDYLCRCGNVFCVVHRFYDQHSCTYDYKNEEKKRLEKENPRVVKEKMGRIGECL